MNNVSRRDFLRKAALVSGGCVTFLVLGPGEKGSASTGTIGGVPLEDYNWNEHRWAYLVDTTRCIGCGMCVKGCKEENLVPDGYVRTWVERYEIGEEGEGEVDSPDGALYGFQENVGHMKVAKSFFVPKICNHCEKPPCVQVCPVGATYRTRDGVVLVDSNYCVGCGYCVQACPYGARFITHDRGLSIVGIAQKCTLCYHRLVKGRTTACVEACPVGARQLADMHDTFDPVRKRILTERVGVLQPELLTEPQCFYIALDKEVR
jgi:Fe-S-cluster-containing dehydrogenase component